MKNNKFERVIKGQGNDLYDAAITSSEMREITGGVGEDVQHTIDGVESCGCLECANLCCSKFGDSCSNLC